MSGGQRSEGTFYCSFKPLPGNRKFGLLYLLGPLTIYLGTQSAVCNITISCCGDCDVNTSAFWKGTVS